MDIEAHVIFRHKTGIIAWLAEHETLYCKWSGPISNEDLNLGLHKKVELVKKYRAKGLIVDQRELKGTWIHFKAQVNKYFFPGLEKAGLQRLAFIIPRGAFPQLTLISFLEGVKYTFVNAFQDFTTAMEWIQGAEGNVRVKTGLTEDDRQIIKKLEDILQKRKAYKDPNLSLHVLAEKINCPSRQLSWAINRVHKTSFREFINQYRIKEVLHLLKTHEISHLSIIGIANLAGFSSKSSFYRCFKEYTGKTPKDYLEKKQ